MAALTTVATLFQCTVDASLGVLIDHLPVNTVDKHLPQGYVDGHDQQVRQDFADKLEAWWTPARCWAVKNRSHLSRRKWDRLRNYLAYTYSHETGTMIRHKIDGVFVPALPRHSKLRNFQYVMDRQYGLQVSCEGLSAHANMGFQLCQQLKFAVDEKLLAVADSGRIEDLQGNPVVVQFKMDKANMHKGMEETAMAFTLVNGTTDAQAPVSVNEFCLFEGADSWEATRKYAAEPLRQLNSIIANPTIEVQALRSRGADQRWRGPGQSKRVELPSWLQQPQPLPILRGNQA